MNETYITFRGWVGGDVELREVRGDRRVARLRVASTPRRWRDGRWEDGPTTWHTVTAWNALADHVAASVRSGQPVLVHGRFEADVWTAADGTARVVHVVRAATIGHDLSRGTAVFSRAASAEPAVAEQVESGTVAEGSQEPAA